MLQKINKTLRVLRKIVALAMYILMGLYVLLFLIKCAFFDHEITKYETIIILLLLLIARDSKSDSLSKKEIKSMFRLGLRKQEPKPTDNPEQKV